MNGVTKLVLRGASDINPITMANFEVVEKKCYLCHSPYMGRVGDSGVCSSCLSNLHKKRRDPATERKVYRYPRAKRLKKLAH